MLLLLSSFQLSSSSMQIPLGYKYLPSLANSIQQPLLHPTFQDPSEFLSHLSSSPDMALGTLSFTLPTFAAAAGVYFFNNHQNKAKHVERSSGSSTERNSMVGPKEKLEKEEKKADRPRFAVELDGLNCFETVVAY